MILSLLLACTSTPMTMGADALAQLDTMRTLVGDHQAAVDAATTLDEVATEESAHMDAMTTAMDEMGTQMDDMMGCAMDDMMSGSMADADTHMTDMMADVTAHGDTQGAQTDLAACVDEEVTYVATMTAHFDAMADDMAGFDDVAECSSGMAM